MSTNRTPSIEQQALDIGREALGLDDTLPTIGGNTRKALEKREKLIALSWWLYSMFDTMPIWYVGELMGVCSATAGIYTRIAVLAENERVMEHLEALPLVRLHRHEPDGVTDDYDCATDGAHLAADTDRG